MFETILEIGMTAVQTANDQPLLGGLGVLSLLVVGARANAILRSYVGMGAHKKLAIGVVAAAPVVLFLGGEFDDIRLYAFPVSGALLLLSYVVYNITPGLTGPDVQSGLSYVMLFSIPVAFAVPLTGINLGDILQVSYLFLGVAVLGMTALGISLTRSY